MFEVTQEGRVAAAALSAAGRDEVSKRADDVSGGSPLHAAAEGAREFHEQERRRKRALLRGEDPDEDEGQDDDESAEKAQRRHPDSGRFLADADPAGPWADAAALHSARRSGSLGRGEGRAVDSPGNVAVGSRTGSSWPGMTQHQSAAPAPAAQDQVTVATADGATLGTSMTPGTASVQHLDFASVSPFSVSTVPTQPVDHIAPSGVSQ